MWLAGAFRNLARKKIQNASYSKIPEDRVLHVCHPNIITKADEGIKVETLKTLKDYYTVNAGKFVRRCTANDIFYVTPLSQAFLRDLLSATHEIRARDEYFYPRLEDVYVYEGMGSVSLQVSPFHCPSTYPIATKDLTVHSCASIIEGLLKSNQLELAELTDMREKSVFHGKWWNDTDDLFTHPVFWTSEQHVGFLMKLCTLMGYVKDKKGTTTRLDGLDDLASFLKGEYMKETKIWGPDWENYLNFTIPVQGSTDDFKLIQKVRNILVHHNDDKYYPKSVEWGFMSDMLLHGINKDLRLSTLLYDLVRKVKQKFQAKAIGGMNTSGWDVALEDVLRL